MVLLGATTVFWPRAATGIRTGLVQAGHLYNLGRSLSRLARWPRFLRAQGTLCSTFAGQARKLRCPKGNAAE